MFVNLYFFMIISWKERKYARRYVKEDRIKLESKDVLSEERILKNVFTIFNKVLLQ